jgi:hypothetical protein
MNPRVIGYGFIFVLVLILNTSRLFFARKDYGVKVEMPSKIQRLGLGVQVVMTYLIGFMALLGFVMKDSEMAIVSSVMTLIFATVVFFTRRKFKKYYEEENDSFYLNHQYSVEPVYYENITDWIPLRKQIGVLDETQADKGYVCVNFAFSKPETLLKKLAEMTFSGKFKQTDPEQADDPHREQEFIEHLEKNGYGYIVDEYSKK